MIANAMHTGPSQYRESELITKGKQLFRHIGELVNLETLNTDVAVVSARALSQIAYEFRNAICSSEQQSLELRLKGKEIPFPLPLRLLQILTKEEIQCFDQLKCELSKTLLIFLEFVVFQCGLDGRRIYKVTVQKMKEDLERVLSTLPENQVETRFHLRCAQAAIQKLDVGIGKWKGVAKDNAQDVAVGIILALLTLDKPGPGTAAPLVEPLINLSVAIYNNLEEEWYKDVWALRWYSAGHRIKSLETLKSMRKILDKYDDRVYLKTDYHLSFCISQVFFDIFQNSKDEGLKKAVFEGEKMSLLNLVKLGEGSSKDFWKTRYITLTYLKSIAEKAESKAYRQKSIRAILLRRFRDKDEVRILAGSIIPELGRKNPIDWKEQLDEFFDDVTFDPNEFVKKRSKKETEIAEIQRGIAELKSDLDRARGATQQGTSGGGLDVKTLEDGIKDLQQDLIKNQNELLQIIEENAIQELKTNIGEKKDVDWDIFQV